MQPESNFKVFNASAGSGKTYTIVKEILQILLQEPNPYYFEKILAVTFTNKAANEMKSRILDWLQGFSSPNYQTNTILHSIAEKIDLPKDVLHKRSKKVLSTILHNYSRFSISTIDKFNLRIMKSFAKDLNLSLNFDVELDKKKFLKKSLDLLFSELQSSHHLARIFVEISLQKMDDEKSWVLDQDILDLYNELFQDQHNNHLNSLQEVSSQSLNEFRTRNYDETKRIEKSLQITAKQILDLIVTHNIAETEFSGGARSGIQKFFEKIVRKRFEPPTITHQKIIEEEKLGSSKASDSEIAKIKAIFPEIKAAYKKVLKDLSIQILHSKIQQNFSLLTLAKEIQKSLKTIKDEENILLISDFNQIINEHLKKQPSAFIYEKIGNRFHHIFIDEFQDTSTLQWENFSPLIENIKASDDTLMIVGDVKQSIYRWRGGNPNLMIDVASQPDNQLILLENNWRSKKHIVSFNNQLYHYFSKQLQDQKNREIYEKSYQNWINKDLGFIQMNFFENTEYIESTYNQVLLSIETSIQYGYAQKDIAVLFRSGLEGKRIAEFLSQKGYDILSNESLLLQNSPYIQLVIDFIYVVAGDFSESQLSEFMIRFFHVMKVSVPNQTERIQSVLQKKQPGLIQFLKEFELDFTFINQSCFSIYEFIETIIQSFNFPKKSYAYFQYFMDFVLQRQKNHSLDLITFLQDWEEKKDQLSIGITEDLDAIHLMTIHKSKGLEFPIVIVPFAHWKEKESGTWIPIDDEKISHTYISSLKNLEWSKPEIQPILERENQLKTLDELNLLYVATTRAKKHLYVIGKLHKDMRKLNFISSGLLSFAQNSMQFNNGNYTMGYLDPNDCKQKSNYIDSTDFIEVEFNNWRNQIKVSHESAKRWEQNHDSILYGNLIHEILSQVYVKSDVEKVLNQFKLNGFITNENYNSIHNLIVKITEHKILGHYFTPDSTIYNERDFVQSDGGIIRPDKVVIQDKSCVIIDYKTGLKQKSHQIQIQNYAGFFEEFGYSNPTKILVYIAENDVSIEKIV